MTALAFTAVSGFHWKPCVTLSANHLFAFVCAGEGSEGWLNFDATETTSSKSEDEVKGGLLLNVVIRQSAAVFELLSCEDKTLLIGGNAFLVLDLGSEGTGLGVAKDKWLT